MRVVHIIPAAFNYFDDIRDTAMALIEAETAVGLSVESFLIQYGSVTERFSAEVKKAAPTRVFQGIVSGSGVIDALSGFDVVHVHTPILGLMPKIIAFKRQNPAVSVVVTYHRAVTIPDLFAFYISCYTSWYLPRLLKVADALVVAPGTGRVSSHEPPRFEANLTDPRAGALDYFTLYHQLIS